MDNTRKREISILLCHYLKQKNPEIYEKFAEFIEKQNLLPTGCQSVNEALNLRYQSFSHDQFYEFIKSLRPKDDFPSIFRRIAPFEPPPVRSEEMAPIKRVYGHRKDIYSLEIDRLSRIIVTASDDCTIKVWAIPSINPIHTFTGHEAVVTNISMNPTCSMVLSSSEDKTICLWSLESGKRLALLAGFTSEIIHYAIFSPTGSMIAAACEDGTIPLWTTADALNCRPPIRTLRSPAKGAVGWISFSPGSEFIAYSAEPNSVVVTALKTLSQTTLELHQSLADRIQFSERYTSIGGELGPRLLTVAYEEGVAAIWCIVNGQWKDKFVFRPHSGQGRRTSKINRVAWDCEEHLLVIAKTNAIYVCDSLNGETIGQISSTAAAFENTTCIIGNPVKRELFFFANRSGAYCLVDVFQLSVICEFRVSDDADFTDAVWDRSGEYVYGIDIAGAITVFKLVESKNNVTMVDCFVSQDGSYFVDRQGKRLERLMAHDIRTCNIPLSFAQSLALRNSAIELKLIQRMISNERAAISTSQSTSIGPPPLHIRLSTEYPVNPHGKGAFKVAVESEDEAEEEVPDVHIKSDTDDWMFVEEGAQESGKEEEEKRPPTFLVTKSISRGFWPDWALATSYDEAFFIPQCSDTLIFFKQAYLEMLSELQQQPPDFLSKMFEVPAASKPQPQSDEDHSTTASSSSSGLSSVNSSANLSSVSSSGNVSNAAVAGGLTVLTPFMRRVNITNVEPIGQDMLLTLSCPEGGQFNVVFPFPERKRFLVPLSKFKMSLNVMNNVKVGSTVTFDTREPSGVVVQRVGTVSAIDSSWKTNVYNCIEVTLADTQETARISPFDIVKNGETNIVYHDHSLIFTHLSPGIISSLEQFFVDPKFACLVGCNADARLKMPMSLTLIRERLDGNWYRSFTGIKDDAKLLQQNVACVYGEGSAECEAAGSLFTAIFEILKSLTKRMIEQSKERQNMVQNRMQNMKQ